MKYLLFLIIDAEHGGTQIAARAAAFGPFHGGSRWEDVAGFGARSPIDRAAQESSGLRCGGGVDQWAGREESNRPESNRLCSSSGVAGIEARHVRGREPARLSETERILIAIATAEDGSDVYDMMMPVWWLRSRFKTQELCTGSFIVNSVASNANRRKVKWDLNIPLDRAPVGSRCHTFNGRTKRGTMYMYIFVRTNAIEPEVK
jgi:hypothetical protein